MPMQKSTKMIIVILAQKLRFIWDLYFDLTRNFEHYVPLMSQIIDSGIFIPMYYQVK